MAIKQLDYTRFFLQMEHPLDVHFVVICSETSISFTNSIYSAYVLLNVLILQKILMRSYKIKVFTFLLLNKRISMTFMAFITRKLLENVTYFEELMTDNIRNILPRKNRNTKIFRLLFYVIQP